MSTKEVAKFMVGMSLDPVALQRFHSDPEGEMRRYGLSREAVGMIKGRDAVQIHKAISENFTGAADADIVNVVVVVL